METRGGVHCVYTGAGGARITRKEKGHTFVEVQLLPLTPMRVVWVNELNLKGAPSNAHDRGGLGRIGDALAI